MVFVLFSVTIQAKPPTDRCDFTPIIHLGHINRGSMSAKKREDIFLGRNDRPIRVCVKSGIELLAQLDFAEFGLREYFRGHYHFVM